MPETQHNKYLSLNHIDSIGRFYTIPSCLLFFNRGQLHCGRKLPHISVHKVPNIVRQQTLKPTSYQRDIVLVTSHGGVISVKSYTMPVRWRVFSK